MGKVCYSWMVMQDKNIPDTVARSTTIPEELGRINYLLSDKTGTLTQNDMVSTEHSLIFVKDSTCVYSYQMPVIILHLLLIK